MVHNVMYTGVLLKDLLNEAGEAQREVAAGRGGRPAGMNRSLPIEKALEDAIVAYKMNGEALRPEQATRCASSCRGGRATCGQVAPPHRGRRPAMVHARGDVEIYRPPCDGRSRRFTFFMDAKSVVTGPAPESRCMPRVATCLGPRGRGAGGSRVSM